MEKKMKVAIAPKGNLLSFLELNIRNDLFEKIGKINPTISLCDWRVQDLFRTIEDIILNGNVTREKLLEK